MTDPSSDIFEHAPEHAGAESSRRDLEWRTRYDGLVAVAHVGDKAVAGISGPWSGKYALTWWERPLPARQLELYDSLDEAKREVEQWARRMRSGYPTTLPGLHSRMPEAPAAKPGLVAQLRGLLPGSARKQAAAKAQQARQQPAVDTDLVELHFAAND